MASLYDMHDEKSKFASSTHSQHCSSSSLLLMKTMIMESMQAKLSCQSSGFLLPNFTRGFRKRRFFGKWPLANNTEKLSMVVSELKHKERSRTLKHCVSAAFESNADHSKKVQWVSLSKQLNAFYLFTRPHTIFGTIVGITSISLLPLESVADLSLTFLIGLIKALVPALLMNIYVVGLNQIFDVEIDKINKPNLPLASEEFSMSKGVCIVVASGILSFAMGWKSRSPPVLFALFVSFLLGSVYSIDLPFLRWKRYAFLAASCILCVRAVLVQIAFFLHMQIYVLGKKAVVKKSVIFATAFMCFFSIVIALFKDIPDVDGDRDFGIQSFSVHLGQERVFWLCIKLLMTAYMAAMFVGAASSNMYQKFITVIGHGLLASILWFNACSLDLKKKTEITSFYMFIWKLFYAEYFLIPFVH